MPKVSQKKNKTGRLGPILTLATLAFFLVAGIYFVVAQTRESKRLEQALIERYDFASKYTPAIDGSVPPQRVEGFIRALEAAGQEAYPEGLIADLRGEIEALKDGSHSSPWPNGPAGMTRESLAPFQERLAELYCSGIVQIELQQKNRGLNLRG